MLLPPGVFSVGGLSPGVLSPGGRLSPVTISTVCTVCLVNKDYQKV